jgi:3-methyladenine DNA glycosylase AlkD
MSSILTPLELSERAMRSLKRDADPEKEQGSKRYFKPEEEIYALGLKAAEIREKTKELYALIKPYWNEDQAMELCELMLPNKYLEAKAFCLLILERFVSSLGKKHFYRIKAWINKDYCANWATTDLLCCNILSPLIEAHPDLIDEVTSWTMSKNRWLKRASIVSFVKPARKGKYIDKVQETAQKLFPDDDDLVQKANGWILRESGKTDIERLEKFLLHHGESIPRTTLRYAIERFPEKRRKEILEKTRK